MAMVALAGEVVSMTGETADKLLELGQGDAALLYVALTRHAGDLALARPRLGWSQGRLDAAYAALQSAGLVGPAPESSAAALRDDTPPEYNTADVVAALDGDASFASMIRGVERQLGVKLTAADLKQLYTVYDFIALPPEVILTLTTWCVEEMEEKYGPGRRPRVSQIKKEARRWKDRGLDTLNAAEEFLSQQKSLRLRERGLLPKLGIRGRVPLDKEREYLAAWVDWGFPDETIVKAYEKTLLKKQAMSWPYMNSILRSWHGKGLHTLREVEAGDVSPAAKEPAATPAQRESQRSRRMAEDLARLKRDAERRREHGG